MSPEDRSKLLSFVGDVDGLKSREPDAKKFREWKEKVEKKLEEACGRDSDQYAHFKRVRFFDFSGSGRSQDSPLSESERREYLAGLDEAKRVLARCV